MLMVIVTFLALLAQLSLVFLVVLKNRRSLRNVSFGLLSFALLLWAAFNYAYYVFPSVAQTIYVIRAIMFLVVVQNILFVLFTTSFSANKIHWNRKVLAYVVLSVLALAVAFSPFLFKDLTITKHGPYPQAGPGMLVFIIHALVSVFLGFRRLIRHLRASIGNTREQALYITFGSVVLWGIVPLTNFVLSMTLQTSFFAQVSPLYVFAFSLLIGYSIIKHKLFDIQFFVVRAAAYLVSIVLLSMLYIVPSILLVAFVMRIHFTWSRFAAGVGVALAAAVFYGPVRNTFNLFTNRLFFRGYYEPQDVINQLSEVLVRSVDVAYIKRASKHILQRAVKTNNFTYWLASDDSKTGHQTQVLSSLFKRGSGELFLVDEHEENATTGYLRDQNIALIVRLRTASTDLGFFTLGYKESGELYNDRDKRLLAIAADEIAISLQNALHFEEIQNFNRTLQQRVADATKELRRSNEKLKALDETKDDFISMASHQLRTPLTSVKGYLSMVLEGDAGKLTPLQQKMLTQAYTSSQRMVYMIADLLNVSRLKTGKFVIEPSAVNLATMVQDEIDQLKETAESRELLLEYDRPKDFPEVMLDETKTRQVVMNFIDNAIYYTPSGGRIKVELVDKPSTVELRVVDDGIGVPKSEQHHLFTKFYRAGNARKARPDGTGLGLFMAKKVIVAQGGSLIFESQEGKGSTFGFAFSKRSLRVRVSPVTDKEMATVN